MALPLLASLDDFIDWEPVEVSNVARAGAILSAASTRIRAHTGRVWVDAAGPEEDATPIQLDTVRTVCLTIASRVYNNPQGEIAHGEGPFSGTVAEWSAYGLALTDDEKAQLSTAPSPGIPGLWSLRVVAPAGARATYLYDCDFWESELFDGDTGS